MRIVLTGGGSGGHITPVLAVAHELKRLQPDLELIYIGQRGDPLADIPAQDSAIDTAFSVRAGKFRRYHGAGIRQIFDVPTIAKNMRDAVWICIGIWQSFWLMRRLKPAVVFTRGGFVSVPVALGAKLRGIPYITHDSDAVPSLANRLIARWAVMHAVALPKEIYPYPPAKTVTVGIPISRQYGPVNASQMRDIRKRLGLGQFSQIIFMTGGGNGAARLNKTVAACVPDLLHSYPDAAIVQLAGRDLEDDLRKQYQSLLAPQDQPRVIVKGFVTNLYEYSAAADVVIMRAGGTSMAEMAAQAKACIVVPNPQLTGGHQTKNAEVLAKSQAIQLLTEQELWRDPQILPVTIADLLDHPEKRQKLGEQLHTFARPDAAEQLAVVVLRQANYRATQK